MAYKEIRKHVIIEYSKYPNNFDFKSGVLDAVSTHNNNIHTTTKYKPCDLFENLNEEIYKEVVENIKKDGK